MGKRCDLCIIPTRFHFYLFSPWTEKRCDLSQQYDSQANGSAKGDDALPCKGLLCLVFFFFLLWFLYCFGQEKGVTFV
ncbi:hypothetical protein GYH30_049281 [Glycine max]|uniref:Uncharacterized protein n=1 Tax=Glycine max TaxID=3847 RepID=A0A0R0EX85_SOYBN|nr:hypothetical protein GYH30_049281 [Glycine max]